MSPQKKRARRTRVKKLIALLRAHFPDAKLALKYRTHWQLLVAVQLSAQSTDKKVNEILPGFVRRFPTMRDCADADVEDVRDAVKSVLYYRNKGKNIRAAANKIIDDFGGRLPRTMAGMLTIPGVARKTANVLLGTLFGVTEGIVVDTHMIRFAQRFDLTDHKDAVRIERDLMAIVPKEDWYQFSYLVVDYGRSHGNPRGKKELRENDPLLALYPKARDRWP